MYHISHDLISPLTGQFVWLVPHGPVLYVTQCVGNFPTTLKLISFLKLCQTSHLFPRYFLHALLSQQDN